MRPEAAGLRARLAVAIAVATATCGVTACRPRAPSGPTTTPAAGITLAIYQHAGQIYGVVDDRRWVEVTDGSLVLDRLDPGVALPSLVIEPLGGSRLVVAPCAREVVTHEALTAASSVRCAASGRGRHLVRVHYVSTTLGYRAQHDLVVTGERAAIATRFTIATPAWRTVAAITLYDGLPGAPRPPAAIARGAIVLDGSTAILAAAPREVTARLRRVFDGARRGGGSSEREPMWAREAVHAVWVWLELEGLELAPGGMHVQVSVAGEPVRDVTVPAAGRELRGGTLRLPLWIDDDLRGVRQRRVQGGDGTSLVDRFVHAVANTGEVPREVWIEERLRTAPRRVLDGGWPTPPTMDGGIVRARVVVAPGGIERAGYAIRYGFRAATE